MDNKQPPKKLPNGRFSKRAKRASAQKPEGQLLFEAGTPCGARRIVEVPHANATAVGEALRTAGYEFTIRFDLDRTKFFVWDDGSKVVERRLAAPVIDLQFYRPGVQK